MNERIRELAEQQAGSILMDLVMPDAGMPERIKWNIGCTTAHLEKFAELIVRECMDIADGQKKWVEDMEVFNEPDANWNRARIQQSQQIVDKIKQHFGVEE